MALVISQVLGEPVPAKPLAGRGTVLEALQAGIAAQLVVLDDASLTGTGQSRWFFSSGVWVTLG